MESRAKQTPLGSNDVNASIHLQGPTVTSFVRNAITTCGISTAPAAPNAAKNWFCA